MRTQELALAKINLALDILGRRADGYHELRMVMQTVSLCDVITVEEGGTGFTLLTGEAFSLPADKVSMEQRAAVFRGAGSSRAAADGAAGKKHTRLCGLGRRQR